MFSLRPMESMVCPRYHVKMKQVLERIVSMLTGLVDRCDVAREDSLEYNADGEYEYRDAEYEYEIRTETR